VNRLRAEIAGGADFGEVAQRESADSASARDGGQMAVWKGLTVQPFEDAAFAQPVGQLGQPVATQYGYHLIRVDRRTADTAYVRHILVPIELTFERETELLDRADSLDVMTETLGLDSIAKDLGLTVEETEMIPGLSFLPGVGDASDGAHWVFEEAAIGDVSEVLETPSAYYALELVSRDEERSLTLEEATASIRTGLIRQKKIARTKERAREAVDRIRAGQTMDAVAASLDMEVQEAGPFTRADFVPGMGRMNAAIGTAFGLRPGETSGAIEANQQVYVIQLDSREDADRSAWEEQKADQRTRVVQALGQQRWESFLNALRTTADVVDNRAELERQNAAAAAAAAETG
jgi:parvulin-like peptidyl-prolyl isomerase